MAITWAFGHLIQLQNPDDYDEKYKKWDLASLPIMPTSFLKSLPNDDGIKRQFQIIKNLFTHPEATQIICATDAEERGN